MTRDRPDCGPTDNCKNNSSHRQIYPNQPENEFIQLVITMKTTYAIAAIGCILLLAAGLSAGCTDISAPSVPGTAPQTTAPGTVQTLLPTATTGLSGTEPTPSTSSAPTVNTLYVNGSSNGQIVTIPVGSRVLVRLNENPTTGYTWNATPSKGLAIVSDSYIAPDGTLVGAPGHRDWILSPKTVDTYTFKAISLRPWVGAKLEDPTFSLVIIVTKA
jgi:inhibitor of cysteine peptidase